MNTPEREKLYADAVETFGIHSQVLKAVEEMTELSQALLKYLRALETENDDLMPLLMHVQEERADVGITLGQIDVIFGENTKMEKLKHEHLAKLLQEENA